MNNLFYNTDGTPFNMAAKTKVCIKCQRELPVHEFTKRGDGKYRRTECKACTRELTAVRNRLRKSTPPPPADYTCPICGLTEDVVKDYGGVRCSVWCLDHDHESDLAREYLCHKCNRGLGNFNDDIRMLQNAIQYLQKYKTLP